MIQKTVKPETAARKEQERIWEKKARTLARYETSVTTAAKYYGLFLTSQNPLDLEIANDWVDAANRASKVAKEFEIDLPAVSEYPR